VAWEFFATPAAREAVRKKVAALFPVHEVEPFTELFWRRIQAWRADTATAGAAPGATP
jgi:glucose-6-phosphate dehydrogenase assembly protein OpcA